MRRRSVLISGVGIAGPALARELLLYGFEPTLVEQAPELRTSGYVIDLWGRGYDLLEEMGLLPRVLHAGYHVREIRIVNQRGLRVGGFSSDVFRAASAGRFVSVRRGDLCAILYGAIAGRCETLWGESIAHLEDRSDGVYVRFSRSPQRRFDLVIGADGLHSRVRELAFRRESSYERFLGYTAAAFDVAGYRPRDEDVYVAYAAPGHQVARFAMRGDRTMFLLVVADPLAAHIDPHPPLLHKAYEREQFERLGWECPRIIDALRRADSVYFDRVSQIRMPRWSKGRICLLGDAAYAPSLLAGQGAALALIGARVLAGELGPGGPVEQAFARYEALLHPFIERKQNAAVRFARSFAPRTRFGLMARNLATYALRWPRFAAHAIGPSLRDDLVIPDYPHLSRVRGQAAPEDGSRRWS